MRSVDFSSSDSTVLLNTLYQASVFQKATNKRFVYAQPLFLVMPPMLLARIAQVLLVDEDAGEILRASGDATCDLCGNKFREHPHYRYPSQPVGSGKTIPLLCDGKYYHT